MPRITKNVTLQEDPWCWSRCFQPDQVPPSFCLDQGEVPQPSAWTAA